MTNSDNQNPTAAGQPKLSPKTPIWKRLLKIALGLVFLYCSRSSRLSGRSSSRYQLIVRARPGKLQRKPSPWK